MIPTVGIDYSASQVFFAVFSDEQVLYDTEFELKLNSSAHDMNLYFLQLKNAFEKACYIYGVDRRVYIEKPWVRWNHRPLSGLQLTRTATYLEIAALQAYCEPVFVDPGVWRKAVYGNGRPDDAKELARRTVLDRFGFETKFKYQHNICEAILIAYYGNLQQLADDYNESGGTVEPD